MFTSGKKLEWTEIKGKKACKKRIFDGLLLYLTINSLITTRKKVLYFYEYNVYINNEKNKLA